MRGACQPSRLAAMAFVLAFVFVDRVGLFGGGDAAAAAAATASGASVAAASSGGASLGGGGGGGGGGASGAPGGLVRRSVRSRADAASGAGANYGAAAPAPECEELPRGVALDQWDFFGVPRRGDHGNESGYGEAYYILTLWDKLVAAGARPTRAVANLGANDGVSGDPTFELFEAGWSGLAVEPSKAVHEGFAERPLWERLWENLPWDRVVKDDTPVTPDNVIAIFERARLPLDLDVLKIDLDSYDIFVVERLLRHSRYRPKIIVMEISEAALGARVREPNMFFNFNK